MEPQDSQQLPLIHQSLDSRYSVFARNALDELPDNFTITDPCISGHPIVFASRGFLKQCGYSHDEVIGRNGRIFQGPETNRTSVMEIREAVREERAVQVSLLNYRKDGTPFWMLFHMNPVYSTEDGRVIHFVAVQVPLARRSNKNRLSYGCGGSCRREVCSDSTMELDRYSPPDLGKCCSEERCEASDFERRKAVTAIDNILSLLICYSESMGRLVCGRRCRSLTSTSTVFSSALNISLGRIKQSFVLTDPYLPDMPIVYASDAFLRLTGYAKHEVLGRNCRFLSGVDTDSSVLQQIKDSIQGEQACTVRILNYRKDMSSFWNLLHTSPVRNATGKIAYFVGVQMEEGCKSTEDRNGLSPAMRQLGAVGAVKVAVRSLSMAAACSSQS
uniref:Putative LOV domain-containing protein n=1 Tax=Viola canadensis TaxID=97421 RepID=A0A126WZS8_9ROSI|nr:putative LOV domain-containing protein [Viola canadensis]